MSKVNVLITVVASVVLLGILLQVLFEDNRHLTIVDVDVKDLVRSGEYVGYQKGSSMENVLKQLKFDQAQLKVYNSPEEYGEALEKGSQNGGVAAIFDETPYIKLFMEKYCGKYRRVGPVYQMKGFGFVFPRGSPLVSDVSKAISLVVGDEKMTQIETRWLGSERSCPDPADSISSITRSFGFDKISGLLVISILMFVFSSLIQGKSSITPRARPTNVPEHMQEVQPNVDLHQARPTNVPEHMQEIQPNVDPLQAHPISVAKQEQPMLAGSPTLLCNTIAPFGSPINVLERLQEEQPMDTPLPHAYVLEKAKQEVQSYNNPTPNDHKKGWFSHSRKEKTIPIKRKKNTKQ